MNYKILASSSKGNATLIENILVECGLPFSKIKPHIQNIEYVLLTHIHSDHSKKSAIIKLAVEKPSVRWIVPEWISKELELMGVSNVYEVQMNQPLMMDGILFAPFKLYHDVDNCGWRIKINDELVFYATDTRTLSGISARGYNYYFLEANYDEEKIQEDIRKDILATGFSYKIGAMNSHLSYQESVGFFNRNAKKGSVYIPMHQNKDYDFKSFEKL